MSKWWYVLLVLVVIGIGGYWFAAVPEVPAPNGSASQKLFQPGPYKVVSETFTAVDESRPTQAYNDYPGSEVRVLNGEIWRPDHRQQPAPLLVYSHGFMSFRQEGLYLINFLASHGYTVVATDYPLTGFHAPDKPLARDVVNQPGDISFLIDTVLQRNADPADTLYKTIDPKKIAAAGVSLGGLTTTLAAFHHRLKDPRIAAAISIAGPTSLFTADFFAGTEIPYLMIYGSADAIVPYDENALRAFHMSPGAILITLANASHAGFAQPASTIMRFIANPDGVGCSSVLEAMDKDPNGLDAKFVAELGDATDGIDLQAGFEFCKSPPIPVAMKAARQHMFTTLASYAFLENVFADDATARDSAGQYLFKTLPAENSTEVSVKR